MQILIVIRLVLAAEWLPIGKELPAQLDLGSLCIMYIFIFMLHFNPM